MKYTITAKHAATGRPVEISFNFIGGYEDQIAIDLTAAMDRDNAFRNVALSTMVEQTIEFRKRATTS